jgi:type I restriction enzyme S subunit
LDALDEQIRRTQQVIAKITRKRIGLISQLLAKINEDDQSPLDEYLSRIDAGWSPDCPEVVPGDGEWGVLKISAVSGGVYRPTESKRLPSNLVPRPALEVKDSDVLCVRANGVGELVGRVVYVESTPQRLMLSDKTLRLVPTAKLDRYFLSIVLGSESARRQIESRMGGSSSQKNISQAELRRMTVPVPDLTAQCRMSAIVRSADRSILANQRTLDKLRLVRSGFATDLLGGRPPAREGQLS